MQIQRGGLDLISVSDDGRGIPPRDLPLACTRFATSKLVDVDDLKSIRTFGFRGEALASASMVARVCITSRVRPRVVATAATLDEDDDDDDINDEDDDDDDGGSATTKRRDCAYKMSYRDGGPDRRTHPDARPHPSAGREGTVVAVRDLFHNVPSRRRALESGGSRAEREEYDRVLGVAQRYAVHEARRGVGFVCRGGGGGGGGGKGGSKGGFGGGNRTDLNTQSLASIRLVQQRRKRARVSSSAGQSTSTDEEQFAATKDVIGHVFGTAVTRELLPFTAGEGDVEAVGLAALAAMGRQKRGRDPSAINVTDGADASNIADEDIGESNDDSNFANSLLEEMMMGGETDKPPIHMSNPVDDADQRQTSTAQTSKFAFAYRAKGAITNGSYSAPKSSSAFLLFINDRLVESSSIRRAVESVYADTLPKGGKPFVYLALELPGPHVDVNVHPTKREVALLHEDRLCDAVSRAVRDAIGSATTSRTFSVANGGRLLPREEDEERKDGRIQLARKRAAAEMASSLEDNDECEVSRIATDAADTDDDRNASSVVNLGVDATAVEVERSNCDQKQSDRKTPKRRDTVTEPNKSASKRVYDPSRLVRTSRAFPVGALEPFLVQKETKDSGSGEKAGPHGDLPNQTNQVATTTIKHKPGCPLFASNPSGQQVDMSMPGAFALAICRCQVERSEFLPAVTNGFEVMTNINDNTMARPKKITPTECTYESIGYLRDDVVNLNHQGLNEMLRGSTYVGAVSRSRSLIQCGIDLIMINHRELAKEMFYQIALLKFNGMPMAKLGGGGVDVIAAISQMLQFEEDLNSSLALNGEKLDDSCRVKVNKTNTDLARQASTWLEMRAPMLEEYFAIKFEKVKVCNNRQKQQVESFRITGLPILLEGHSPQPHGLPLFLLRLATEVDWEKEMVCFKGVCAELASFYSELPSTLFNEPSDAASNSNDVTSSRGNYDFIDNEAKSYIKHTLFPAISYLLVPPRHFADNGAIIKLANLNSLYKVFERC